MIQEELCIGDWVTSKKWREQPFKLTRINDGGKYFYGVIVNGSKVGPFFMEELEPIPITPEIMEKNEWKWVEHHSQWELVVDTIHIGWGFYKGCISVSDWADEGDLQITSLRCEFIHKLQHALRICGIEKEIVL